ncbi:MAG TPA: LytTR family DNA-binding domain-containing protein [Balneolaceae bacterium]|nr:LytTR family DNA-binding domain-containing protein [Balneolaceae bacterium]
MKILIAEDEPVIAQRIERFTRAILGDRITGMKHFKTLKEAKSHLEIHQIDLLFLDLNLKGKDGFQLLEGSQAGSFYTVVISAYSNRAIQAFNYPVVDFIEKPFNKERLIQTFERLENFVAKNKFASKFISIKRKGEIKLIEVDHIIYLKGAGVYSELFLGDEKKELHHLNLKKVNRLLPSNFVRIHRSYIVNMYFVRKIVSHGGSKYNLSLKDGSTLPISRNHYPKLKNMLNTV